MARLYIEKIVNNAITPTRETTHSACYDVRANLLKRDVKVFRRGSEPKLEKLVDTLTLLPHERAMIPTGWRMCCDPGWKIEVAPRSGLSIKKGFSLINCIGILDADYRHEVMLLVINSGMKSITIHHEERVTQLSLEQVYHVDIVEGPLPNIESNRDGGMGSTD